MTIFFFRCRGFIHMDEPDGNNREAVYRELASSGHQSFLREIGADEFIDYTKTRPEDIAHNVDVILDTVGGPATGRFLRTLKRGGALYPVYPLGFSGAEAAEKLGVTISATQVRSNGAQLAQISDCSKRERFASPSIARFRWRMLDRRTNERPADTYKARSC